MFLPRILEAKRREVAERKTQISPADVERRARTAPPPRDFAGALRAAAIRPALIAEVKKASPSAGVLRPSFNPVEIARSYHRAGAAALSVLTDGPFFQGSLEDLSNARAAVPLPALRKDFLIDPYQIHEARAAGADAVLLIVACLSDDDLRALLTLTQSHGMAALVEVHDAEELARALAAGATLVGINNRDLATFRVDLETTFRLLPAIPSGVLAVAESGIHAASDIQRLRKAGLPAVLIGEAFMKAGDIEGKVRELFGA